MRLGANVLAVLAITQAQAQDLDSCSRIPDGEQRLECYDLILRKKNELSTATNWTVHKEISRIDDSQNVYLSVLSSDTFSTNFKQDLAAELFIHCRENTTMVAFQFAGEFMSDLEFGEIQYRIDKQKAKRQQFTESTDHEVLGLWGGSAIEFIKQLYGAKNLLIRATPYNESPVTVNFPIAGIEEVVKPVAEACHWNVRRATKANESPPADSTARSRPSFLDTVEKLRGNRATPTVEPQ